MSYSKKKVYIYILNNGTNTNREIICMYSLFDFIP